MPLTALRRERRRTPRSDELLALSIKLCLENEARVKLAAAQLGAGDTEEALKVLEAAIETFPTVWELRADFMLRLRLELEALREAVQTD